ncbi:MAG TPA: sigma-70 family RNA polymerase sigma factor [Thermoleophilaceae bacterium]|nr:sigma-70 family RNA polymerase sigma factor [Thermoleophilaceae bacterium]
MLRTQSDARLVDLIRAGHTSAFEAIVQRYRGPLLGYCSRLLPASRAEDAVQQTFLKAYQAMMSGDAELNLRPWLYRIAHNASLNLLRQNGWSHEELDENMDGVQRPDQALELRERLGATVAAVKALPERQRNAVLLREIDGLSYEEIAAALGVGDGAVRQLLHRARATLRSGLTALTPAGLTERVASALAGGGTDPGARVAELAGGLGAGAGALKLGAAVLATGVIATGAATVPLRHHSRHSTAAKAASITARPQHGGPATAPPTPVNDPAKPVSRHPGGAPHTVRHHGGSGSGSDERHGSSHHTGSSGDDRLTPQEPAEHHSGSDGGGSGSGKDGSGGGSNDGQSGSQPGTIDGGGGSNSGEESGGGETITVPSGGIDDSSDSSGGHDGGETLGAPTGTSGMSGPTTTDQSGKDGGGSGSGSGKSGGD